MSGRPWNALVTIGWNETDSDTNGVRTQATGSHLLQPRWGRTTRMVICPDMVMLKATLEGLGKAGEIEALAAPIAD